MRLKYLSKLIVFILIMAFVLAGCSKSPTQQVNDAKAKVKDVTNDDTKTYAKEELATLNEKLNAALDEVKAQDDKLFFKDYDNVKTIMLPEITVYANKIMAIASQRKADAKGWATTAQSEAKTAVDGTKALWGNKSTSKKTKADFKADIEGLGTSLDGLQKSIDKENYFEAIDTANTIKGKAASISNNISDAEYKNNEITKNKD
jgi:hypothetical protein